MASATSNPGLVEHLKQIYSNYRHTGNIDDKGAYFSPECIQICRPRPTYAARNRETIVRYLHEAAANNGRPPKSEGQDGGDVPKRKTKAYYTIRPLLDNEFDFGTNDQIAPSGFASASLLKAKAKEEGWAGMRVDLWDSNEIDDDGNSEAMLVKVQYWWRKEGEEWLQICHDIMYLGRRDGTEGVGQDILE